MGWLQPGSVWTQIREADIGFVGWSRRSDPLMAILADIRSHTFRTLIIVAKQFSLPVSTDAGFSTQR
jgi:hypothetical protein